MSLLNSRWVMWERPTASAAHSTARCAMLLLGGAAITPPMPPGAGLMVTSIAVLSFFSPMYQYCTKAFPRSGEGGCERREQTDEGAGGWRFP